MKSKKEELQGSQNSLATMPGASRAHTSTLVQTVLQQLYPSAAGLPKELTAAAERYALQSNATNKRRLRACMQKCPGDFQALQTEFILLLEGIQLMLQSLPVDSLDELQGYMQLHKKAYKEYLWEELNDTVLEPEVDTGMEAPTIS